MGNGRPRGRARAIPKVHVAAIALPVAPSDERRARHVVVHVTVRAAAVARDPIDCTDAGDRDVCGAGVDRLPALLVATQLRAADMRYTDRDAAAGSATRARIVDLLIPGRDAARRYALLDEVIERRVVGDDVGEMIGVEIARRRN